MSKKSPSPSQYSPVPLGNLGLPDRPQRRARLVLEIEADTPDDMHRALGRAISRLKVGAPAWAEESATTNGLAQVLLDEDAPTGEELEKAQAKWDTARAVLTAKVVELLGKTGAVAP